MKKVASGIRKVFQQSPGRLTANILLREEVTVPYRCGWHRNCGRNRFLTVEFVTFEARLSSYGEITSNEAARFSCLFENTGG
jgi:hypothetical protein